MTRFCGTSRFSAKPPGDSRPIQERSRGRQLGATGSASESDRARLLVHRSRHHPEHGVGRSPGLHRPAPGDLGSTGGPSRALRTPTPLRHSSRWSGPRHSALETTNDPSRPLNHRHRHRPRRPCRSQRSRSRSVRLSPLFRQALLHAAVGSRAPSGKRVLEGEAEAVHYSDIAQEIIDRG